MFCTKCGSKVADDQKYCMNCGAIQDVQDNNSQIMTVPQYATQYPDMGVGDWLLTFILTVIPVVGAICLLAWALSSSPRKQSRKTWAKAQLIVLLILIILYILAGSLITYLLYCIF